METITENNQLQRISEGMETFEIKKRQLQDLAESAKVLDVTTIADREGYKRVSAKRKELKAVRVQIEKDGKALRDLVTPISKMISAKEKELIEIISSEEKRLQDREDWIDNEIERIRLEKEAEEKARIQKRIDQLSAYNVAIDYVIVLAMTDEQFNERLAAAKSDFEAEQKRIEEERIAAEYAKKAEEERLKKIAEEQAAEASRLKAIEEAQRVEREKMEAERKAIEDERARIEAEKQAEIEHKRREAEMEQAKKDAGERALKDAEEKRIREEKEKREAEDREKAEAERKEALLPDKEKLNAFALQLTQIITPSTSSDEANEVLAEAQGMLSKVAEFITDKAKVL